MGDPEGVPASFLSNPNPGESVETHVELLDGDPFKGNWVRRYGQGLVPGDGPIRWRLRRNLGSGVSAQSHQWYQIEFSQSYRYYEPGGNPLGERRSIETIARFIIRKPEMAEMAAYEAWMELWAAVIEKQPVEKARSLLAELERVGESTPYYLWGLYYYMRLCIEHEDFVETLRLLDILEERSDYPRPVELEFWRLYCLGRLGMLVRGQAELQAFREKAERYFVLPEFRLINPPPEPGESRYDYLVRLAK
jgi:hypothetical protein